MSILERELHAIKALGLGALAVTATLSLGIVAVQWMLGVQLYLMPILLVSGVMGTVLSPYVVCIYYLWRSL